MKQGGAESRGSETRPLERLLMKDERDTRLESSGAFIMPQSPDSTSSGHAYVGKIGLGTFEPVPVPNGTFFRYFTLCNNKNIYFSEK